MGWCSNAEDVKLWREYHTATLVERPEGDGLYFIGGEREGWLTTEIRYLCLNFEDIDYWLDNIHVKFYGTKHSANLIGKFIVFFGGCLRAGNLINHLKTFNI